MKLIEKRPSMKAPSGDRLSMLATLVRKHCISYKTLLKNLADIIKYDETLLADTVLLLTDKNKITYSQVSEFELQNAIIALRFGEDLRTKKVLIAALSEAMQEKW